MSLTVGVARPVPPFLLGFDCLAIVTDAMLREATGKGFRWCGRYLENLRDDERQRIHSYGYGILPYTEAMIREPLTAATGRARGELACSQAAALGIPADVHVGIDLELPMLGSDVGAHVNHMAGELLEDHLAAALYVGDPQPSSGAELFAMRPNRYIKGGGRVAEPACGWSAIQLEPLEGLELAGVKVDVEMSKFDYLGRALVLWWPS